MKVYLAAPGSVKKEFQDGTIVPEDIYVLESYYSMQDWFKPFIPRFKSFLLDSGVFTFMSNAQKHGSVDWLSYADGYADFIKEYKCQLYFELDIDAVKGLQYAEMLRNRIEQRVGWASIPVWHVSRGKDYFISMCRDYKYVAFGGIITDGLSTATLEKYFPWFINTAHKNGAKIHGLGYTNLKGLMKYHFDSVDSTTWTMGNRFGQLMQFKNGTIIKHNSVVGSVKTRSIKDLSAAAYHNFSEWLKFQRYADNNL